MNDAGVKAAMKELGVAIDIAGFSKLIRAISAEHPDLFADRVYRLAHEALHGPHGYAWQYDLGATMLVVRDGDRLVIGAQEANAQRPFPPWGWKIKRWSKDLAKNKDQAAAWAKTETKDVVAGTLVRPPARGTGKEAEGAALLAAIVAKPTDKAARLVYADWLLERGDKRGDLIHLHQKGKETDQLARKHRSVIFAPYPGVDDGSDLRTGFVEVLDAFAGALAKHPEIFEREPFRVLHLVAMKRDDLAKVAKSCGAGLARITQLHLEGRKSPKHHSDVPTAPAVIAPLLPKLEKLRVEQLDEKLPEWRAFFTGLRGPVTELDIEAVPRGVFDILGDRKVLPSLKHIRVGLQEWCFERGAAEAIAVAKLLAKRNLASVELSCWHPNRDAMGDVVEALLAAPKCKVTIDNCTMDEDTEDAFAKHARVTVG